MKSETITSKEFYSSKKEVCQEEQSLTNFIFQINSLVLEKMLFFRSPKKINLMILAGTFLLMIFGTYLVYELQPEFYQFNVERLNSAIGFPFLVLASVLLLFKAGFIVYSIYLYFRYKPVKSVTDELLPTCTVIVPAYNEGKLVWDTLLSIAESDYPQEKLQLLAIDDGS
ncbi:MAG: glycosyltransferase, partial [Flavobacterium lindanitolerans]